MLKHLFTSESVTEGHPDKLCDQISDAVLAAYLAADPHARVACEVAAATGLVLVMGEVVAACSGVGQHLWYGQAARQHHSHPN